MRTTVANGLTVRLSSEIIAVIKERVKEIFGKNVRIILFGSRIEENERGGDIDL